MTSNNQRSEHELKGLRGGHPLGALAAFGLLRVFTQMSELTDVRLRWREDDLSAMLIVSPSLTSDELIEKLVERQVGRAEATEFNWADDIRTDPNKFSQAISEAKSDRCALDFLSSFGCELALDGKENLKPTAFHMTTGQQRFLKVTRKLAMSLEPVRNSSKRKSKVRPPQESFREALFGPWQYEDVDFHSLGWDPQTERLHALQAKSPTSENPRSVRAAVWLMVEALPLFPCAIANGVLQTRGFSRREKKIEFSWPLWKSALSLDAVRSVIALKELTLLEPNLNELRARGIFTVFRVQRANLLQGRATFRAARPCL